MIPACILYQTLSRQIMDGILVKHTVFFTGCYSNYYGTCHGNIHDVITVAVIVNSWRPSETQRTSPPHKHFRQTTNGSKSASKLHYAYGVTHCPLPPRELILLRVPNSVTTITAVVTIFVTTVCSAKAKCRMIIGTVLWSAGACILNSNINSNNTVYNQFSALVRQSGRSEHNSRAGAAIP